MDFISWSVFGILFILAETATGTLYLLAIGLAFVYPAVGDYLGASGDTQLTLLIAGVIVHSLIAFLMRKLRKPSPVDEAPSDIGERVEVIEWDDEGGARVMYRGKEWEATKAESEMPNAEHGIIQSVQYGRLIISTTATENAPQ